MENFDEYFKQPTQEETDKAWLRQLCYDGQMDDDEIDEFVEAVYQWKERCLEQLNKPVVSGKQPDHKTIRAAAVNYSNKHREHDRWMKTKYYCFKDFKAGAQWALSKVACATAKVEERKE